MSRAALLFTSVFLAACSRAAPGPAEETPAAKAEPEVPAPAASPPTPAASTPPPAASAPAPAASVSARPAAEDRFPCGGGTCRRGQVCQTPGSLGENNFEDVHSGSGVTPLCVEASTAPCGARRFERGGLREKCRPRPSMQRGAAEF